MFSGLAIWCWKPIVFLGEDYFLLLSTFLNCLVCCVWLRPGNPSSMSIMSLGFWPAFTIFKAIAPSTGKFQNRPVCETKGNQVQLSGESTLLMTGSLSSILSPPSQRSPTRAMASVLVASTGISCFNSHNKMFPVFSSVGLFSCSWTGYVLILWWSWWIKPLWQGLWHSEASSAGSHGGPSLHNLSFCPAAAFWRSSLFFFFFQSSLLT